MPSEYIADSEGCAVPLEVLGNAKRCVNIELMEGGMGFFKWSEINGGEDEAITYTIEDGVFDTAPVSSHVAESMCLLVINWKLRVYPCVSIRRVMLYMC